jgi:tartrate-resistant acid phosphatase type 5
MIGDFGYKGNSEQKDVAYKLNEIASEEKMDFVISTGDNFYDRDPKTQLNDETWESHWANVY